MEYEIELTDNVFSRLLDFIDEVKASGVNHATKNITQRLTAVYTVNIEWFEGVSDKSLDGWVPRPTLILRDMVGEIHFETNFSEGSWGDYGLICKDLRSRIKIFKTSKSNTW